MELEISRFQKEIISPWSGQAFLIGKVRRRDFLREFGMLPLYMSSDLQKQMEAFKEKVADDPAATERVVLLCLSKGVIKPRIWFGPDSECPDGQIHFDRIGDDADYLTATIIEFSFDMAGLKDFENFFRGAGTRSPGPDGEEIRPETVHPATDGDRREPDAPV